jgi:hypothetical protein
MLFQYHLNPQEGVTKLGMDSTTVVLKLYFTINYAKLLLSGKGSRRLASPASCYLAVRYRNEVVWFNTFHRKFNDASTKEVKYKNDILKIDKIIEDCINGKMEETFVLLALMTTFINEFLNKHIEYEKKVRTRFYKKKNLEERIKQENENALDIFEDGSRFRMLANGYVHQPPKTSSNALAKCNNTFLSPYQTLVKNKIRPQGPMKRMIVAHRVGAGKTKTMISVFNNYDEDPRARLLLFSNTTLIEQFFDELLKERKKLLSRFRRHLLNENKVNSSDVSAYLSTNSQDIVVSSERFVYLGQVVEDTLDGKGVTFLRNIKESNNMLCGPVYATTYDNLNTHYQVESNRRVRTVFTGFFEWGKCINPESSHFLDNMIILMDEIHIGLRNPTIVDILSNCEHSVVVGFTGTIPKNEEENFVKVFGKKHNSDNTCSLQDSIHYFDGTGNNMFFQFSPTEIKEIDMGKYVTRQDYRKMVNVKLFEEYDSAKLISKMSIANLHLTFTSTLRMAYMEKLEIQCGINKGYGLKTFAPIVFQLMEDVEIYLIAELKKDPQFRRGAMILSSKSTGMGLISELLEKLNKKDGELKGKCGYLEITGLNADMPTTNITTKESEKTRLNGSKNLKDKTLEWNGVKGEGPLQIFMINTDIIKEGLNVLRIGKVFSNSYFESYSDMIQTYGRADRRCSPQSLNIQFDDMVTFITLPKIQYVPKLDQDDKISVLMNDKFNEISKDYNMAEDRNKELTKYSIK